MYLHVGQEILVREKDILGIFDLDNTTVAKMTREFLGAAEKRGDVIITTPELPKSFILCHDGENTKIYLTQISAGTLKKRWNYVKELSNL